MDNTSKLNLLKLLNEENALHEAELVLPTEIEFSAPEVVSVNGRDTKVMVASRIDGDDPTPFPVYYHRRVLSDYFSQLEFDDDGQVTSHSVLAELTGDYIPSADDIVLAHPTGNKLNLVAQALSYEWRGSIEATIIPTISLKDIITVTSLGSLPYPDHHNLDVGQAQVYSYDLDCSFIGYFLNILVPGIEFDDTSLAVSLNTCGYDEVWVTSDDPCPYNLRGAEVVFEGAPSELEWGNDKFERVTVIKLGPLCTNIQGNLNLHYNLTTEA